MRRLQGGDNVEGRTQLEEEKEEEEEEEQIHYRGKEEDWLY